MVAINYTQGLPGRCGGRVMDMILAFPCILGCLGGLDSMEVCLPACVYTSI